MAQEVLNVEPRQSTGKRRSKRMRQAGKIPAVLYGHGEAAVSLSLDAAELTTALRHNVHIVKLNGAASDDAFLKKVQWDAFGSQVLHVDLTRVSSDESVEVELEIVLRGQAPGTKQGGVVEHHLHRVRVKCPVNSIPENLELNINSLELGESLTMGNLEIPVGAETLVADESVIASCVEPVEELEEESGEAASVEPEVIGTKKGEEEGQD